MHAPLTRAVVLLVVLSLGSCECSSPVAPTDGGRDAPLVDAPRRDAPDAGPVDGYPTGAISFFVTACPVGWDVYRPGLGHVLLASGSSGAGTVEGDPLLSGEDRVHGHDATLTATLGDVSYAGIAGGGNGGLTASGDVSPAITVEPASAGLPYVQLVACRKTAAPGPIDVPQHVVAWFESDACPSGWSHPADLDGRWPVGLPEGAEEATFGGTFGLGAHTHTASGELTLPDHGIALASGCCAGGYAAAGPTPYTTTITPTAIDLPTFTLRACTRD